MKKDVLALIILTCIYIIVFLGNFITILFNSSFKINNYKEKPEKDTVNIVFITDKNYAVPLQTAIKSAIYNKNKESKYHIFIIGAQLENEDTIKLQSLENTDTKITILNQKNIYNIVKKKHHYVSRADLFKFNLAKIFLKFDKILYLDCDIIINKDLSELYNTDLEDNYAGAVQDIGFINGRLNFDFYFNNGVMLLNLNKMRQEHVMLKLLFYKIYKASEEFMTQDCFNAAFKEKVKQLPLKYNVFTCRFKETELKNINDAVIIHFTGEKKPWKNKEIEYSYIWEKYSKLK
ncbi:MAG: glycosyltransferase family 8 protein [Candidatus Gastranaerophilales bacterium]|nr:glycosyltransferase family 8 protein [Candidatus Gastranaerophilales bacterium]